MIEAERVSYAYEGSKEPAVHNLSLRIEPGEFVAILGHNGSGKSTFAKLINALYLPSDGRLLVCGMDTRSEANCWAIRQRAGMVFQNPDNQIVATLVEEDVAFGPENIGVPPAEIRTRVDGALAAVGMSDFAQNAPHMLSGGQKQRVAIAGALAMRPDVLILDEATAMLDPVGRREVMRTVRSLRRSTNMAVLWITHFMEEAICADRVIVLHEGEIALEGSPRSVFRQVDTLRKLRLGVPPMTALAASLKARGLPISDEILTVEEMAKALLPLFGKTAERVETQDCE